jgi:hypothetical protein
MSVSSIDGIGPTTAEKLKAASIRSIDQLAEADAAELAEQTGLSEEQLEGFIARAIEADSPSELIDEQIAALPNWQGETLSRIRRLIHEADPDGIEEVKWRKPTNPNGVPVWSHDGIICTGETYQDKLKLTFTNGASLDDPADLFNASLDGNERRAIDIYEGDDIDEEAFKSLIRAAVAQNTG